ncbi:MULTISPECIES: cellulase family glycosylhydrolase [Galbibacter]|uniref:Cellulase family glycosylhydrolase n=1 Tax=Galbibacter pacificus TaxID=2996052 RepID=A0ABT6FVE2_9FLAO|nr:cellulase family glycosylhydrolase [Galbibacter pacificus]MDG3583865.1 cellulase family glycosylhydrolase [Galbibacter pacificus]MDG3587217.1 cellulase family glycosylhydrolase [Galbibacter pacificus]
MKKILIVAVTLLMCNLGMAQKKDVLIKNKWSAEKANNWYAQHKWISGANFIPSTAINQLEMWQEDTFDPETIDRELGYAEGIGFNTMRVYLHSLAYKADKEGFKKRVDQYLKIANKHGIQTILVIFDDVWDANPKIGKQREPKPGTHNSGWMQDPGYPASKNEANFPELETYVKDIIKTFANDNRVLLWDLYNEPGNNGKSSESLPLLKQVFTWAREVNPSQPISVGIWKWNEKELNEFQVTNSDIVTYHDYEAPEWHLRVIQLLESFGRPLICTEYMARTRDSRFSNILPMLKEHNIGAINWGLVNGKTNTIYAWDTPISSGEEPIEWFHDIFRKDGTPYRQDEVDLIKKLNNK